MMYTIPPLTAPALLSMMLALPTAETMAETYDVIGSGFARPDQGIPAVVSSASGGPGGVRNDAADVAARATGAMAAGTADTPMYFYMRLGADSVSSQQGFLNRRLILTDPTAGNKGPESTAGMADSAQRADGSSDAGFTLADSSPGGRRNVARNQPHPRIAPTVGADGGQSAGARRVATGSTRQTGSTDLRTTTFLDFAASWRYSDLDMDLHRETRSR